MASEPRPNTGGKAKPKKAKPLSQEEQSERFIQTARELESDESGEAFARATNKILPAKQR